MSANATLFSIILLTIVGLVVLTLWALVRLRRLNGVHRLQVRRIDDESRSRGTVVDQERAVAERIATIHAHADERRDWLYRQMEMIRTGGNGQHGD